MPRSLIGSARSTVDRPTSLKILQMVFGMVLSFFSSVFWLSTTHALTESIVNDDECVSTPLLNARCAMSFKLLLATIKLLRKSLLNTLRALSTMREVVTDDGGGGWVLLDARG